MSVSPDLMIGPYFPRGVCYNPGSVAAPLLVRPLSDLALILVYLITVAISVHTSANGGSPLKRAALGSDEGVRLLLAGGANLQHLPRAPARIDCDESPILLAFSRATILPSSTISLSTIRWPGFRGHLTANLHVTRPQAMVAKGFGIDRGVPEIRI